MKKLVACLMIGLFVLMVVAPAAEAKKENAQKGDAMAFIAGCCFGIRSGAAYNEGKDLHWREWGLLIPGFDLYVWWINGYDTYNGIKSKDLVSKYGANFY